MVFCCVPGCGTDSGKCDPSITFHELPNNPVVASKWINQVCVAIRSKWTPKGGDVFCSKHFLSTDFKDNTDALKPFCVPTIFGHKFIGENASMKDTPVGKESTSSPLIVKVSTPIRHAVLKNVNPSAILHSQVSSPVRNLGFTTIRHSAAPAVQSALSPVKLPAANPSIRQQVNPANNNVSFKSEGPVKPVNTDAKLVTPAMLGASQTNPVRKESPTSAGASKPQSSTLPIIVDSFSSGTGYTVIEPGFEVSDSGEDPFKVQTIFQRSSAKQTAPVGTSIVENDMIQTKLPVKRCSNGDPTPVSKKKKEDVIEISPNTFLKINPDIIKINKKLTPSGNTVLQFLMDPKVAKSNLGNLLPQIVQGPLKSGIANSCVSPSDGESNKVNENSGTAKLKPDAVQHVLGHLVDTHDYLNSCSDPNDVEMTNGSQSSSSPLKEGESNENKPHEPDSSFLDKAPVLLTTKMPISHCFNEKPKLLLQLKQKGRQVAALKSKIANMQKKIDDLEDRCIVQERQLSYSFIKNLKNIRKNAAKGDPCATYILEQIRSYTDSQGQKMRWSDSTLAQCAIWCRKAPYAYEYFKKAEFFKLPCLGTVKRFMKKHPDVNALKKIIPNPQVEDGSSSDFEFDESDGEKQGASEDENAETASTVPGDNNASKDIENQENYEENVNQAISTDVEAQNSNSMVDTNDSTQSGESPNAPEAANDSKEVEVQEIMLPSGEILQCLSSDIGCSADGQYFIIPNMGDQAAGDTEYSIVSADSLPVILQNIDSAQHEQLIFIANTVNQECSETVIP